MALLEKWTPSRDLERLRHEFDDLLERFGFEHGGLFKKSGNRLCCGRQSNRLPTATS
jgi:hypothetical protein